MVNKTYQRAELVSDETQPRSGNRSLAFVIGLGVLSPLAFLVLPVLLGALFTEKGYSETELGLLATTELLGIALAAASGLYWVTRGSWRRAARFSLLIIAAVNLLTYGTLADTSLNTLLAIRFIAGAASGCLMAIVYSYIASHPQTERAGGIWVSVQVTVQVIGIFLLPKIIASGSLGGLFQGAAGIFLVFAIFAALLIAFSRSTPERAAPAQADSGEAGVSVRNSAFLVLFSFMLFFVAQTSIWGFLEIFGTESGMRQDRTILALTIATAMSVFGPLVASFVGDKFGQRMPIIAAAAMQVLALLIVGFLPMGFAVYLAGIGLFLIGWNYALPYQFGVIADVDPSHRYIVLTSPAQALGIAIGPVYGGIFIENFGYAAMFAASGAIIFVYLACVLPFARR